MPRSNKTNKPVYKAGLRDKLEYAAKRDESGGRSLGYGDRTMEGRYAPETPTTYKKAFRGKIQEAARKALKKRARGILGETDQLEETTGPLGKIEHPAQLIPTIRKAQTLTGFIKAIAKR